MPQDLRLGVRLSIGLVFLVFKPGSAYKKAAENKKKININLCQNLQEKPRLK